MLVLSRKRNETIVLPTIGATVQVLEIGRGVVRLGIAAPPEVPVHRAEVQERFAQWQPREPHSEVLASGKRKRDELARCLHERLTATGIGLGLLRLQVDAGQTNDARSTLVAIQRDFQLLLHGVAGEVEHRIPPTAATPQRQTALLVEDNANERELLATLLRRSGLQVDTAGDGVDALDYLRSHDRPDVILLDMGLPRVDGPTTVRQIRRDPAYAGLKIFGVTGHAPDEFELSHGPDGVDRWFQKPVDLTGLLHGLTEELAGCSGPV